MSDIERKLASVQKIAEIKPIEGADRIVAYRINGWWVVDSKDKYEVGDYVVFCEVDSWIPHELAPFLSKGKEPREFEGVKGERLKTVRLRGQISQGLILPIPDSFIKLEDTDCTDALGIRKWERPIPAQLRGLIKGNFPSEIPKTDQERVQNIKIEEYVGQSYEVTEKLHGCFLRNQLIETWQGTSVTIGDIVSGKIKPTLIGVDPNGNVVPCDITEVFRNGNKDNWLVLQFEPYSKSGIVGKSGKLTVTSNHKIFTKDMVEVSAGSLRAGDVVLMQEAQYCDKAMHYFRSGLLGDGGVGGKGHHSYNETHVTKHNGYLEYIRDIFKNVPSSFRVQASGFGSEVQNIKLFATSQLKQLRQEWYPNEKVCLPKDISWIDDFAVAKWYMDDGSLAHSEKQNDRACFATNSFSEADVNRLAEKLVELYAVSVTVYEAEGWRIRVNYSSGSIHTLWKAIAPHVHPSMRYKLPKQYTNVPFKNYGEVSPLKKQLVPVKIISTQGMEPTKDNFPSGRVGYDIETTTHNYFCGGILVHNSSMTCFLSENGEFHVCSRNLDLKFDENNAYWKAAIKFNVEGKMRAAGLAGVAIQGELCGEGINGNNYRVGLEWFVFDVYVVGEGYVPPSERRTLINSLGLKHVPVVSVDSQLTQDIPDLLEMANGKSYIAECLREGFVYKSEDGSKSFKVISNEWLCRYE